MERATFNVEDYLALADHVIIPSGNGTGQGMKNCPPTGELRVGVDLGTAYLVLVVLDETDFPVAGEYRFAQVVRDGLVVDFIGATDMLRDMKMSVEKRLGRKLTHAASGYPPGVPQIEVRATAHVIEAAGISCTGLIDEPSAANNLLHIQNGAIVDVGGGTTGIAIIKDGQVIYTADEPTGGTHFSLVIAGALNISFEDAEELKKKPGEQSRLFPVVRPVMEKVGNIISRHVAGQPVDNLILVGGCSSFPGMATVVQEYTGLPTRIPNRPLFVTPLGIAMHDSFS
ncbi:MAG TPA: ethanolamine utilization protein EutJ [Anaerolineaceae bacterium]|nr:ethanolamine utilization protein EutJ [Anaerolineaceae bacterium]